MPEAEETYNSIEMQLRERWGERSVDKLQDKIRQTLKILANTPYLYPIKDETTGLRRCVLHKNCALIYKIDDYKVVVVCFWDNRQEPLF
jgi:plasmid stabilization system protein ParE